MTSQEYIKNELEIFIKNFPKVRVRYEYDKNADIHFIEVVPNEVYHLDNEYIAWERDMDNEFIKRYPMQNICFISDDALVGIENAEYILCGLEYAPFSTAKESVIFDSNVIFVKQNVLTDIGNPITYYEYNKSPEDFRITADDSNICQTYYLAA
jgi:hypothetical protein